ncbi:hypothetical protein IE53DRAFT_53109 [Violaceomyces palustris]|uniref:Uncharacterized protein n=1 Tax=Violaceomyces palustris TaxID=1673888 RepID=A0ACD0P009_9BASI|nr:hypothetical protein IE53DRAFT_53109 [Violaceomyces palustris]
MITRFHLARFMTRPIPDDFSSIFVWFSFFFFSVPPNSCPRSSLPSYQRAQGGISLPSLSHPPLAPSNLEGEQTETRVCQQTGGVIQLGRRSGTKYRQHGRHECYTDDALQSMKDVCVSALSQR